MISFTHHTKDNNTLTPEKTGVFLYLYPTKLENNEEDVISILIADFCPFLFSGKKANVLARHSKF